PPRVLAQQHLFQIIQWPGQLEEQRLVGRRGIVLERGHALLGIRAFIGHDPLHDLVTEWMFAYKDQVVTRSSAFLIFEAEWQDELAAHLHQRLADFFQYGQFALPWL